MSAHTSPSEDSTERLLRRFYRDEMPSQFPPAPGTLFDPAPASSGFSGPSPLVRGRIVLAVSVSVVLIAGWLLLARMPNGPLGKGGSLLDGKAERRTPPTLVAPR